MDVAERPSWYTPRVRLVLIGAAIVGTLLGIETLILHLTTDPLSDVRAYYDAGARLNAGLPLYEQTAPKGSAGYYIYPPLLAILFRPLALLPFEVAALIWEAALIVAMVLTIRRLGWREPVILALGMLALPIGWSLAVGQAQVLVTYFLALGSPLAVAFAANLKVIPGLVAIWWVGRREWRPLGRFLAFGFGLLALQFVLEPANTLAYFEFLRLDQVGDYDNRSLYAFSPAVWAVSVVALAVVALRFAPTKVGWFLAVALSVFATPRLLMYQVSTLLAGMKSPDER